MKKMLLLIGLVALFLTPSAFSQIPGKYEIIVPHRPPPQNSLDQVRIYEVFAFDCGHCYEFFQNQYPRLKKKFGNKIKIFKRPIGWRGHDPGRLYFIAEEKGKGDKVIAMIFDFMHEKGLGNSMYTRDKLQFVAKLNGLEDDFKKRMDDPAIVRKMNQSVEYSDRRDIDSTPTIVIENAIKPNRTFDNLVTIINALLKDPVP